jgi:hypothetical protein
MKARGAFEHNVALILTPKQWERWRTFMRKAGRREDDSDFDRHIHRGL